MLSLFLDEQKWAGTSWTWGENRGDEGWQIDEMEEPDAWHGRPTGDTSNVWSMRLPGGILIQCPRMIASAAANDGFAIAAETMRLAWLPEEDNLVRIEASILAMDNPIFDDDGEVIGFRPPRLVTLRTDKLLSIGELEGASLLERQRELERIGNVLGSDSDETLRPTVDNEWQ